MDFIHYAFRESIILLAETIIYWIFYNGIYDRKQRGWKIKLILAFYPVSVLIGSYWSDYGGLPITLKAICLIVTGGIITKLLFYANWRSIMIHQVFFFLCALIGDSIVLGILSILQASAGISTIMNNFTMLAVILSKIFNFSIILFFIKKFGKETNRYTLSETLIFMLQGISGMACLVLALCLSMNHNSNLPTVFLVTVSTLILVSYFVFYRVLENNIMKRNLEQEVMKVHFYNQGQYEYYATLEQENFNIKKMYHKMKNHLIAIQSGLKKESIEITNTYIQNCLKEVEGYNEFFDTGNKLADIILYEKCSTAKKNNIKTKIMIQKDSLNNLEMLDLCTILTNSFDNATAACNECKGERFIQVKTFKNDAAVIFTFKNNYEILPALNTKGELIVSKRNRAEHVSVMQSLKMAASKYNGDVEININKEKKEFLLIVMIPITYQKAS